MPYSGNPDVETFYRSGEMAVLRALNHIDGVISEGPTAHTGALVWSNGGIGDVTGLGFSGLAPLTSSSALGCN